MNWLKNLKIIQKLLMLISLCVVFIGLVGFVGYHFTQKTADGMISLYNDRALPIAWLNEANGKAWNIKSAILEAITYPDKKEAQIKEVKVKVEELKGLIEEYSKTKLDPDEVMTLNKLNENFKIYYPSIDDILVNLQNNQISLAKDELINNEKIFSDVRANIKFLAKYNSKVAKELNEQGVKDAKDAIVIIVSVIALAVVLATFSGLLIANMIAKPVNQVVDNLKEVANGNLRVTDVNNDAKDEIGVLAQALNATVATLKGLVGAVVQSAEDISANSEEMSASSEQTAQGAQQTANSKFPET